MYRDVPFAVETMEQIERDLLEARRYYGAVERIFLLNGDAFASTACARLRRRSSRSSQRWSPSVVMPR